MSTAKCRIFHCRVVGWYLTKENGHLQQLLIGRLLCPFYITVSLGILACETAMGKVQAKGHQIEAQDT